MHSTIKQRGFGNDCEAPSSPKSSERRGGVLLESFRTMKTAFCFT